MRVEPGRVRGRLTAPASKSVSIRALVAAALAEGRSRILGLSDCADAQAAIGALRGLGASFTEDGGAVLVASGGAREPSLRCGESGLCLRMLPPIAALGEGETTLEAEGSLQKRPVGDLERPLKALGAECSTAEGFPPVRVRGPLRGGEASLDGAFTSQVLTGLLFALPLCRQDSLLHVTGLASGAYIEMTLEVLAAFGVKIEVDAGRTEFRIAGGQRYVAREYAVEGDWSGAAFPLVAGAIAGEVEVEGLRLKSTQADERILGVLRACGALVDVGKRVRVRGAGLRAFHFDVSPAPDLLPSLATLACFCEGTTELSGIGRTRQKESDRVAAVIDALGGLGAQLRTEGDRLLVTGGELSGGSVSAHGDHRIAMAAGVAALRASGPVEIEGAECVAKSYPAFFADLRSLQENA